MSKSGFRLGKVFGIDVFIDWSWGLIFLLVTWNLATAVLPAVHPGWSTVLSWTTAFAAALLFFASVLAHELAHSMVARARGLPVSRITLFLFGGVSNIEREPESPDTEFLMAIVGPLTSLILGLVFLTLGGAGLFTSGGFSGNPLRLLGQAGPIPTLLLWLGPINIVLAVFNMVPGFPLDGGRVLRSVFWAASHNLRLATRWASWIGQGIAWTLIGIGIAMALGIEIPYFGAGVIGGLWMAFIGWFLQNAARQSYRQVLLEDVLDGVSVSTLMRPTTLGVTADTSLSKLMYDYMMNTEERAVPVLDGECLVGMVTLADVRGVPREEWDRTRVADVMTPEDKLTVATPRENATQALSVLANRDIRQLPVVQEGRLVGILRHADIVRYLQLHTEMAR